MLTDMPSSLTVIGISLGGWKGTRLACMYYVSGWVATFLIGSYRAVHQGINLALNLLVLPARQELRSGVRSVATATIGKGLTDHPDLPERGEWIVRAVSDHE
jgi:hypothetical protein